MYAVIRTGGKQERVEEGHVVQVELLGKDAGEEVTFQPVLLVDGDNVISAADALAGSTVTARVIGEVKGPKITGFTYKNKKHSSKRWGHRQGYDVVEITGISKG